MTADRRRSGDLGALFHLCADIQLVIDAPCEKVWQAVSTTEGLRSWYSESARIDLRLGGKLYWKDPATTPPQQNLVSRVLSFDPGVSLALKAISVPTDLPSRRIAKGAWSVVYIEPVSSGKTRVRVRCFLTGRSRKIDAIAASIREGAEQSLRRLRQALAPSQGPINGDHNLDDQSALKG